MTSCCHLFCMTHAHTVAHNCPVCQAPVHELMKLDFGLVMTSKESILLRTVAITNPGAVATLLAQTNHFRNKQSRREWSLIAEDNENKKLQLQQHQELTAQLESRLVDKERDAKRVRQQLADCTSALEHAERELRRVEHMPMSHAPIRAAANGGEGHSGRAVGTAATPHRSRKEHINGRQRSLSVQEVPTSFMDVQRKMLSSGVQQQILKRPLPSQSSQNDEHNKQQEHRSLGPMRVGRSGVEQNRLAFGAEKKLHHRRQIVSRRHGTASLSVLRTPNKRALSPHQVQSSSKLQIRQLKPMNFRRVISTSKSVGAGESPYRLGNLKY